MNRKILQGIVDDMEFEVEIGGYKVSCTDRGEGAMNLQIEDLADGRITSASVEILKAKDGDDLSVRVGRGKSFYYKGVPSWGWLVDHVDQVVAFVKESATSIIRGIR